MPAYSKIFRLRSAIKGELLLRGEAIIGYKDFEKINEEIADIDARYKNPT